MNRRNFLLYIGWGLVALGIFLFLYWTFINTGPTAVYLPYCGDATCYPVLDGLMKLPEWCGC